MSGLKTYAENETKRMDAEKAQRIAEKGYKPFLKIEDGAEVILHVPLDQTPRDNTKYVGRKVFRVIKDGEELDWSIGTNTPLYRELMALLAQGKADMKVVRHGAGREDTRYYLYAIESETE